MQNVRDNSKDFLNCGGESEGILIDKLDTAYFSIKDNDKVIPNCEVIIG